MSDFEVMPIGTKGRLAALDAYARKASRVLISLAGDKPELMTKIGDEPFADPLFCAARIEGKLRASRQRFTQGKKS